MKGILVVTGTAGKERRLPRGAFAEVSFTPAAGEISAFAGIVTDPLGDVDPNPDEDDVDGPFDPDFVEPGNLEVSIRAPSGKVMASGRGGTPGVRFDVPASLADGPWRVRMRNGGNTEVLATLDVRFVKSRHVPLTTPVAQRVLNHGLRTALDALGITVHIDGENSFAAFSPDLERLSGIDLPRRNFDGKIVGDLNLETIAVTALRAPSGRPMLRIFVDFETEGVEIGLGPVDLVDVTAASIVVEVELENRGFPGSRTLVPNFKVIANVDANLTSTAIAIAAAFGHLLAALGVGSTIDDLIEFARAEVENMLNHPDVQRAVGRYVPEALVQLARRGHVFHQLDATNQDFLVTHFDPKPPPAPEGDVVLDEPVFDPHVPPLPLPPVPRLDPDALANLAKIRHIVVLMQENRSFDNMLGFLAMPPFGREEVDGVKETMANSFQGATVTVNALADRLFPLSPEHGREQVAVQIAQGKMSGFLASWRQRYETVPITGRKRKTPLSFYTADQVRTYRFLADNYLICTRWFAAFPGPTQPNRFCTLSGFTPVLDNFGVDDPELGHLETKTIFELLDPDDWVYFEKDIGFIRLYDRFRIDNRNVVPFDDPDEGFVARASKGALPTVTFIDPNFVDIPPIRLADDDLPPADVKNGQDSIACIYNTLVNSPAWNRTLLVITYDEHGGFFDHVPPPGTPPSDRPGRQAPVHPEGPAHLGVRVPAFVISPWVDRGDFSAEKFDHTSIGRTILLKVFGEDAPDVSARMVRAAHLGVLLTRDRAREDRPRIRDVKCPARPVPPPRDPDVIEPKLEDDFRETMRRFGRPRVSRKRQPPARPKPTHMTNAGGSP
jgi:phospholipase C